MSTKLTPEEYAQALTDLGLHYGVRCEHNGMVNEGASFMYIAPAEPPWVYAVVLVGDMNCFYEGRVEKVHCGLKVIE